MSISFYQKLILFLSIRVEGLENDEDAPRHISHVEEDDVQVDKNISLSVAEVKVSIPSVGDQCVIFSSGTNLLRIR